MKYLQYLLTWIIIGFILGGAVYGLYLLYNAGYSLSVIILLSLYIINSTVTFTIFVQKRHNGAKLSWLLSMALFPVIGHIFFLIFGQRYKNRKEFHDYHKKDNFKYELFSNKNDVSEENLNLFKYQSNISKRGIYKANINLYKTGDKGYKALFKDLRSAKEFIHLHYYIIKPGEIYEEFKEIITKKAKEGVKVKFIIDDFGRWAMPWYEIKYLKSQGIEVKIFGKVHFPFIGSENGFRTHRKLAIIDGKIAHTGGLNISDEYANLDKKYGLWIDFQARISGAAVRSFSLLFIEDWFSLTKERLNYKKHLQEEDKGQSNLVMLEDSPENKVPVMQDSLVNMILNSKKSIHLTTPYFIPTPEIFSALRTACLAGVDVNIYIPGRADKKTVIVATRYYANELMKFGAKIYQTKGTLIHSKIGMFDERYAYIGTANIDIRSLYSQFEIMSLVEGPVVNQIKDLFTYYQSLSKQWTDLNKDISPVKDKLIRFYVNLFSPIM